MFFHKILPVQPSQGNPPQHCEAGKQEVIIILVWVNMPCPSAIYIARM
jgi:hypothetical protein